MSEAAETVVQSQGGGAPSPVAGARAQAEERIKRGRGRPKGTGSRQPSARSAEEIAAEQALYAQAEALYEPQQWEPLVRAPADIMLASTGHKYWELQESEVKGLAVSASSCAKFWAVVDPKWLALTMFAVMAVTTYGARAMMELADRKKAKAEKENHPPK